MAERSGKITLRHACDALESLAPTRLAQSWDNVGLLAGDREATVRRVLLCIDLTPAVASEAVSGRADLVVAYHPPIFKPVSRLVAPSDDVGDAVFRCISNKIAIYSTHTALDAAEGGTNDVMARLCGIQNAEPLEYVTDQNQRCKIAVFVPAGEADLVAEAMFAAGAGRIGNYEKCSFRIPGTGTFYGDESTDPTLGEAERFEKVDELRLEVVTTRRLLPQVVRALRETHSYDEPAFDIYPIDEPPQRGIGRYGPLPEAITLAALAKRLKNLSGATCVQTVGALEQKVSRAVVCVGAAGSLPFHLPITAGDVVITGEIRHHDALTILRHGGSAVALGHWASERPVLEPFQKSLSDLLPKLEVVVSEADCDPFAPVESRSSQTGLS